jgi:hypothetical protein
MANVLSRGDDSPRAQLRAALALFAMHSSRFVVRTSEITDEERRKVALETAYELLDGIERGTAGRSVSDV